MSQVLTLHTDGGARGNPGPSAAGIVFHDPGDQVLHSFSKYLGVTTNNQAEYQALVLALQYLQDNLSIFPEVSELHVFMDSELIINQLNGKYKIKHPDIIPLARQVFGVIQLLPFPVTFTHVPRSQNSDADALVNQELDKQH
jgi:ribonuclease HI